MKIICNVIERKALSKEKRANILALIKEQGLGDVMFAHEQESQALSVNECFTSVLDNNTLMRNLIELQQDALKLEEQVASLKEQNDYLEEKVRWLRSKTGGSNSKPLKAMLYSSPSLGDSGLPSALVRIINRMESKARKKTSLSFSKSKRVRRDKALITQSEYFDKAYVTSQLEELGLKIKDPLEFFVLFGAELELSPSEKFDTKSYLEMNPDVKDSGINPLLHYIKHGKAEGRVLI